MNNKVLKVSVVGFFVAALTSEVSPPLPGYSQSISLAQVGGSLADQNPGMIMGASLAGILFDGSNIWIANPEHNSVTELGASDGKLRGTFAVGTEPSELAFDGTNVW